MDLDLCHPCRPTLSLRDEGLALYSSSMSVLKSQFDRLSTAPHGNSTMVGLFS